MGIGRWVRIVLKQKIKMGGGRKKMKLQEKTEIGAEKGQRKKSTSDGTGIEKRILSVHHPSMLVHWWVLVHSGPLFFKIRVRTGYQFMRFAGFYYDLNHRRIQAAVKVQVMQIQNWG